MPNFIQFGLPSSLIEALKRMQITVPTDIQRETIPVALKGQDLLASAQTGSGKTVAYALPMILHLTQNKQQTALVLTPTRELATQVYQTLHQLLGQNSPFKTALLIGGAPMFRQIKDLKQIPQLIIGTPGRITDHLMRGTLSLNKSHFLVIDEADRMLDMGFGIQIDKIAEYLPANRQTLMFSATFPPNIEKLSNKHLRNPQRVSVGSTVQAAPQIKQEIVRIKTSEKFPQLLEQLDRRDGSIIIFVKTKRGADRLSKELKKREHSSNSIHGDLPQRKRDSVIREFRNQKTRILVATDVAARGLDIPHVMHVINYDLPQCPEDYIHRIGRTGRAGAEGNALCIIAPEDNGKWKDICRLMNPESVKKTEPPKRHKPPYKSRFYKDAPSFKKKKKFKRF